MKSKFASNPSNTRRANLFATTAILGILSLSCAFPALAQVNVLTQHNDNLRTGSNTNETFLTPANVNAANFGTIFSYAVDGLVAAQPLYVSGVNIPGQGVHNVVYVVTLHDSVYAFDADSNQGTNATPLWTVNFTNPAAGITTEPGTELGCTTTTIFTEMGILGTPVIDSNSGTMYLVAKTKENGTYHFHLHALDITTGIEKMGAPLDLTGTVTGKAGTLTLLTAGKNMMSRPGMLLSNGTVYIAFGSNGCDGGGTRGWVLAYDASSLVQLGIFNDEVDSTGAHGNIWMAGDGLATDGNGNIFFSTANGPFDANLGNRDYGSSLVKIGWGTSGLTATDYFTPYNQAYLNSNDLDIGSAGVTLFPDQPGPYPHLMVGSGKEGSIYLVNRDNMGGYNPVDNSQIVQFLPFAVGLMESTAVYWNGNVYFTGSGHGATSYSLSTGQLTLLGQTSTVMGTPHTPSISANGTSNGILWIPNSNSGLLAFDASLPSNARLYSNTKLGTTAHFNTPTIANGHVYVGTNLGVQVLGLFANTQPTSGNGQATQTLTGFPTPLQTTVTSPYTGLPMSGITVTFNDNKKGGTFNPVSAVSDANGNVATNYTAGKTTGTITVSATSPLAKTTTFSLTVTAGAAVRIQVLSGNSQSTPVQTTDLAPLVVRLLDANLNGVPGLSVTFSDGGKNGAFSANPVVTDGSGKAQTFYTTGAKVGALAFKITSGSLSQGMSGKVTAGPATTISIVSGNNQSGAVSTTLANPLVILVVDQFNNVVPGAHITFSDGGVGGSFSTPTIDTDVGGRASVTYTLPPTSGIVNISASFTNGTPVNFTETAQ